MDIFKEEHMLLLIASLMFGIGVIYCLQAVVEYLINKIKEILK